MSYHWHIGASTYVNALIGGVHIAAMASCFLNALSVPIQSLIALFVCWQGIRYVQHNNQSWQLFYHSQEGWRLAQNNHLAQPIEILASTVITRQIIFLHYQCDNQKYYKMIAKAALLPSPSDYRQLLVTLKTDA
ncbi:MAG TPA: hypothetical protein DF614_06030 [Methylococcaceae bacterium]|nr:hypothetical protein [Methylococcaceae bacterium]